MKLSLALCVSVLAFSLSIVAIGQTDSATERSETSAGEQNKSDESANTRARSEKKAEEEKSNAKPPKKVFKPSEEISEDLPVPFPVDI